MTIDGEGIQVYSFDVDPRSGGVAELEGLLSAAELARADRFRFANDRGRYVRTHGTLRRILARFVRVSPAELAFEYGPQGKPVLARHHHGEPLHFNLSRSGGLAVVAVTRCGEVGIDVEQVRPLDDVLAIARRMFAPAECAALLALPVADRLPSFLWYWARKEAVVKAIGRGLSYSLQAFVLSAEPGEAPERLRLECEGSDVAVWVRTLPGLPGGYTAAVASSFAPGALRVERWEDPG